MTKGNCIFGTIGTLDVGIGESRGKRCIVL
jgi:hypothetical protein